MHPYKAIVVAGTKAEYEKWLAENKLSRHDYIFWGNGLWGIHAPIIGVGTWRNLPADTLQMLFACGVFEDDSYPEEAEKKLKYAEAEHWMQMFSKPYAKAPATAPKFKVCPHDPMGENPEPCKQCVSYKINYYIETPKGKLPVLLPMPVTMPPSVNVAYSQNEDGSVTFKATPVPTLNVEELIKEMEPKPCVIKALDPDEADDEFAEAVFS